MKTKIEICSYLKFIFDLAGVGLGVQPADVVVEGAELAHRDGSIATEACFQDGIMHKHILLLHGGRGRRYSTGLELWPESSPFALHFATINIVSMVCLKNP